MLTAELASSSLPVIILWGFIGYIVVALCIVGLVLLGAFLREKRKGWESYILYWDKQKTGEKDIMTPEEITRENDRLLFGKE